MFAKRYSILAFALLFFAQMSQALDPVYASRIAKVAINGYDPVAYFSEGAAFKGKKEFQYKWKGVNWRFYTEDNMNRFSQDPEAYEPQFGGYCAYAVGLGKSASSDPSQFTIVDGKLYLNYNSKTKTLWRQDHEKLIAQGNEVWPRLISDN